jgi:hypothetical protein
MEFISGFLVATVLTWSIIGVEVYTARERWLHLVVHLGVQILYTTIFAVSIAMESGGNWEMIMLWPVVLFTHWLVAMGMISVRAVKARKRSDNVVVENPFDEL